MNSRLIYAIFYLAIAIWSFYDWRKYKSKNDLWFFSLSLIGFFAEIIYYCLIAFQASSNILSVAASFFFIFDPILILLVIWIGIRSNLRKQKNNP